ncbi:gene transfer agent family protein [Ensifer sp. ENS08]|uniref:gene transfer agent family protein n=1 Tax=Ensifer sp. ENS08 TaxID=2769273 RepID=UPI00177F7486|nr:gene transfer agent family protein [Ensifer sp. ENS08]MBD9569033.1 gene transfer agent family protein [Ensifer sp. ENS08]
MRGSEEIVWPGGEHAFRLGIGELRAIEQKCDAGCAVVLMRLLSSAWKIDDVIAPLRLGLIGAGMSERDAQRAVDAALDVSSPYALAVPAADVLQRFIMGNSADKPGGDQSGES